MNMPFFPSSSTFTYTCINDRRTENLPVNACSASITPLARRKWRLAVACLVALCAQPALSMDDNRAVDQVADVMAVLVLMVVPVVVVVLFWMVHALPEKIAHKRHHPQRDAITTLCLLSLVFGGLLWPLAWLWAYTRPIGYRSAYGTDKHEDYYIEMAQKQREGTLEREDLTHLREDLDAMQAKGALPPRLRALKDELVRLRHEEQTQQAAAVHEGGA